MWILVQYIYAESDPKHKLSFIDNVTSVHKRNIEKYTNQRTPKTQITWQMFHIVTNLYLNSQKGP